jgi:hypothetical protein
MVSAPDKRYHRSDGISPHHRSDEDQRALMIVLDSLVKRSEVSRVMAEL